MQVMLVKILQSSQKADNEQTKQAVDEIDNTQENSLKNSQKIAQDLVKTSQKEGTEGC